MTKFEYAVHDAGQQHARVIAGLVMRQEEINAVENFVRETLGREGLDKLHVTVHFGQSRLPESHSITLHQATVAELNALHAAGGTNRHHAATDYADKWHCTTPCGATFDVWISASERAVEAEPC